MQYVYCLLDQSSSVYPEPMGPGFHRKPGEDPGKYPPGQGGWCQV